MIDQTGVVRLKSGAKPTCSTCELVVVATDEEGSSSVARVRKKETGGQTDIETEKKDGDRETERWIVHPSFQIVVKNTAYTAEVSSSTVLTIIALFALFGIVLVITLFLLKQVKSA